jgi:hypothetical protein
MANDSQARRGAVVTLPPTAGTVPRTGETL